MDTTQPTSSPVHPDPKSGPKMAYIIVGIFCVIVLIAVAIPFTLNVFNTAKNQQQTDVDAREVAADSDALIAYRSSSSVDALKAYADGVDARLAAGGMSEDARNLLIIRKALVIATVRGDEATVHANADMATKIFKDFINKKNPNKSDLYFRDFSIVALTRLNLQCCSVAYNLMDGSVPLFDTYSRYTQRGYSPTLSALLALDDATTQLTEARRPDIMNRLNSVDIAVKILRGFEADIDADTKSRLLKELKGALDEYSSLKPITYNDPTIIGYESANKLAMAYDLYYSNQPNGTSADTNAKIDRQYEDALNNIKASLNVSMDKHGLNEVLFYNLILYLESIDRRYEGTTDKKNHDETVASILNLIKTEPTVADIGKVYFRGLQQWKSSQPQEMKKLTAFTHFMDLSKNDPSIAAYLKSINVTW